MELLKSPYFLAFSALYLLAVVALVATGVYALAEPLFILAIFGFLLPGTAYLLCRGCAPLEIHARISRREIQLTFALVIFIAIYLVWGGDWLGALVYRWFEQSPRIDFFLAVVKKLLVFVLVPYLLLSRLFGYRWRDFGFTADLKGAFAPPYLRLMLVMFVLFLAIQYLVGQAAQPIFRGEFSVASVVIGGTLLYLVQIAEVGLVEEFFFRAIVQTRLAIWLKSETAGLFLMALIFGLAHAPGLYLRQAGAVTALGTTPDLASVLGYSIAVLSLAGLVFGVIWAKTRNIYVLILIHAWVDTLPGLPEFIETFGLN